MDKKKNQDPRFAQAKYDPRFDKMNRKHKKVEIDDRFKGIIEEEDKYDKTGDLYYIKKKDKQLKESVEQEDEDSEIEMN